MTGPVDSNISDPLHTSGPLTASFATVNATEAFGGVASPLGWTFWANSEAGFRKGFVDMGLLPRSELAIPTDPNQRMLNIFYGRSGSNLVLLGRVADRLWGSSSESFDEAYLAGKRGSKLSAKSRGVPFSNKVRFVYYAVRGRRAIPHWRAEVLAWWQASVRPGSTATIDEARTKYREASDYLQRVMRSHVHVSWVSQALLERLKVMCVIAGVRGLELELISSEGGFEEQALIEDLWSVSRGQRSLDDFLALWGFHGHREGELSSLMWREDPSPLLPVVDAYRAKPEEEKPSLLKTRQQDARKRADAKVLKGRSRLDQVKVRFLVRHARTFIPLRQTGRGTFLMAFDVARCMARRIGAQLAVDGVLADAEDVFYLTESELLGSVPDDVAATIAFRRERRAYYRTLAVPDHWTGELTEDMVRVEEPDDRESLEPSGQSERIDGIGVSVGVVEGRALVVDALEVAYEDLENGDILVCVTTDPSWSAVFYAVAGVVTDIGAEMSHGAILSREIGIPAVVNTHGATKRLSTGDRIRVDGTNGVVEVIERVSAGSTRVT